jgi:hypothetical protein
MNRMRMIEPQEGVIAVYLSLLRASLVE